MSEKTHKRSAPGFWPAAGILTLILALVAAFALWPGGAHGQEFPPPDGPPNCYSFRVEEVFEGSPKIGFLEQLKGWWWFACPAGEVPAVKPPRITLHEEIDKLAASGPPPMRARLAQVAKLSADSLRGQVCDGVSYIRSVSPPDPDDGRDRSAQEIARWWCEVIAGVGYSAKFRRCDFEVVLAPRPPEVVSVVREWDLSPAHLKLSHDSLKSSIAALCPRTP